MSRLWIAIGCVALIACDKKPPPSPPIVDDPGTPVSITGSERLGWDQPASDTVELAAISYVVYVDGARVALAGTACASTPTAAGFACTAPLPSMSAGAHTLELASLVNDGGVLESARSAALRVTRVAQATSANAPSASRTLKSGLMSSELPFDGLGSPMDLAFAPDGRMFIAERGGRIFIRPPSPSAPAQQGQTAIALTDSIGPGVQLIGIALDPQFSRRRDLFAIYAAPSRSGDLMFTLARFRETGGTLGAGVTLLDGVPASAAPAAALRFGPDGKLYVAIDDGGDPRRRQDLASFNGKVLRLEPDGTTPADARGGTPVYAAGYGSPIAMDWDPETATLWVADRADAALPFTFYRGTLFAGWAGRLLGPDVLFAPGERAGVRVLATGPDGAIYFGAAGAVGRVVPDRGP